MQKDQPPLIILAGANRSGKSTLARTVLPARGVLEFLNADDMARGLSPLDPSLKALEAGKLLLTRMDELIVSKSSFALETTLSGTTLAAKIKAAKAQSYHIDMFYIYTGSARLNLQRIKTRVRQGGHDNPARDVTRRYTRSLYNLFTLYPDLCDRIEIYGNEAGTPELIARLESDGLYVLDEERLDMMIREAGLENQD